MLMTSDGAEGHVRTPFYTGDYSFISLFTFYIKIIILELIFISQEKSYKL